MLTKLVILETIALAESNDVEPVSTPALAVVRRRDQAIDEFLESVRRVIGKECVDLLWRRRQSQEIVLGSTQISCLVGGRRGRDLVVFDSCQNERVDRMANPFSTFHRRNLRP